MGTFHHDKGDLHGITVVVDTGPKVYIGRCHEMDDQRIVLMDVDEHADGENGRSKEEYVKRAAEVGVWRKHAALAIPRTDVVSVIRLGDIAAG